ncbi:PREDICTED: protein trunk-like [Nicrophorus vespilloides]|uniref:Protein trunk-like n=1 Tax=Nicrophorus vespilloides TaxID=110193 RepID=A0ABM1MM62_NICVS|nr:PREDICTED: protein trunk-like [Nicrophorus vespilloides]
MELVVFLVVLLLLCESAFGKPQECSEIPEELLGHMLGSSYNTRYMSIRKPINSSQVQVGCGKRESPYAPAFYVNETYAEELSNKPAWTVDHIADGHLYLKREKRAFVRRQRQWTCKSKIVWFDLGVDYFPRFLRSVHCMGTPCWYGHRTCKPKPFVVKLLKRRRNNCKYIKPGVNIGPIRVTGGLFDLWIWEERYVNFCCFCN